MWHVPALAVFFAVLPAAAQDECWTTEGGPGDPAVRSG